MFSSDTDLKNDEIIGRLSNSIVVKFRSSKKILIIVRLWVHRDTFGDAGTRSRIY